MPTLYDKVSILSGLGAIGAKALSKVGVRTIRDLLYYFPYRYEDYSKVKQIADLRIGDVVSIRAELISIVARRSYKSGIMVTDAVVSDETGELTVKWFNQPFLAKIFKPGDCLSLAGQIDFRNELVLINPRYEKICEPHCETLHTGRIVPIYPRTGSVGEKRLRKAIKESLLSSIRLKDALPEEIKTQENFPSLSDAVKTIHFPNKMVELDAAIARLKFDELFLHQLMFAEVRKSRTERRAHSIPVDEVKLKSFVSSLPFTLTKAQKIAAWEVVQDIAKEHPMNRLLEGDVGSGKTVVAAMAIDSVLHASKQAAYLAPTEVLAKQQARVLGDLLRGLDVALLTSGECFLNGGEFSRTKLSQKISLGEPVVIVATHALLEEEWNFKYLALVIVDEQHRFGVAQRHELLSRGGVAPHLLSMSATPIPRSLSLTIYGDLDLSLINQLPKGRKPIDTKIIFPDKEREMYKFVKDEIAAGNRVFVVCPLIDPSDKLGVASVSETAERLRKGYLKNCEIAELNGRMKTEEKEEIMQRFKAGEVPILVSTTVVEVGVDVPEATVMIVEGAERFGLAQLHQLRGRVGRSEKKSFCFLHPSGPLSGKSLERLQAMVRCQNGFELAELDLKFRGPGNVFGNAQSGFPDFKLATLSDVPLMKNARDHASRLLESDPTLENHPLLLDYLLAKSDELHLE